MLNDAFADIVYNICCNSEIIERRENDGKKQEFGTPVTKETVYITKSKAG